MAVLKCHVGNEVVKPELKARTQPREFDENINGNATSARQSHHHHHHPPLHNKTWWQS